MLTKRNALLSLAFTVVAGPALALEDHAVVIGEFTWIVEGNNNNVDSAVKQHFVPSVKIDRQGSGLFRMVVTMPPTLSGGQAVKATYDQVASDDEFDLKFVNKARPNDFDYLNCNGAQNDTWDSVNCNAVTLKSLKDVPLGVRQSYAQQRYSGTTLGQGMGQAVQSIGGAEPAGQLTLVNRQFSDYPFWIGVWNVTYSTPTGQLVNARMYLDGYTGSYQAGNAKGALTYVNVDEEGAHGNWQMGNATGYFNFARQSDGSFTGTWNSDQDASQGSWNGVRQ